MPHSTRPNSEKYEKILEALRTLLETKKISQISVSEIAQTAGIGKGSIYYYFSSKEAIFDALMAKSYEEPLATAKELAKRTDISPFVRMAMIFQACRNSSAAFLKIQSDAGNGVQENAFLHNKYINYLITELKPVTGEIIRQGAAEGLIVCQQPDALAEIVLLVLVVKLDNTLILFLSDNGCSNEDCQNMSGGENDRPDMTRDGKKIIYPRNKQVLPGPQTTYASLGARWSNVANTPFRFWKAKSYEGGICTPMIAHWPKGIKKNVGGMTSEIGHVMDIMATCVDLADAEYPATYKGHDILPMEGKSLLPIFKTGHRKGHDYLGFEHFNERAFLSNDGWKLVRPKNNSQWELYNLNEDRSEQHDLAAKYPEKVTEMAKAYEAWAKRCMVEPYPGQKKK